MAIPASNREYIYYFVEATGELKRHSYLLRGIGRVAESIFLNERKDTMGCSDVLSILIERLWMSVIFSASKNSNVW